MKMRLSCNGELLYIDRETIYSEIHWDDCGAISEYEKGDNGIRISINNNRCVSIYMPPYYVGDLFYSIKDEMYIISDSLYVVAEELGLVTIDKEMEQYFALKGYCPIGTTIFKEIARLKNNVVYHFDGSVLHCYEPIINNEVTTKKSDYIEFKRVLNGIVDRFSTENQAVLLSGGADSRLIALLLASRNSKTKIITGLSNPMFYGNAKDVYLANEVGNILGLEIINTRFDFKAASVKDWHNLIELMPCCSHPAFLFQTMFSFCRQNDVDAIWSGQNMDTLYNLGPTEQFELNRCGIGAAFKRFFLSEEFFKTLPDIKGKSSFLSKIISQVGVAAFKKAYNRGDLTLPKGKADVVNNFTQSRFYTVFGHGDVMPMFKEKLPEDMTAFDLKKELFKVKMSFLKGGDSSVISASGKLNNIKVVLPYSEPEMVDFFDNLHLTKEDIFNPKRFVYQYINEFSERYGKKINMFKVPKKIISSVYGEFSNINEAFDSILKKSNIGNELERFSGFEGKTPDDVFYIKVHRYWLSYEYKLLCDRYNVKIK